MTIPGSSRKPAVETELRRFFVGQTLTERSVNVLQEIQILSYIISVFIAVNYRVMSHLVIIEKKAAIRLLILDDSQVVRERLETMLSEVPKVETNSQTRDQQEARELVRRLDPDVVMLDVQMPIGSGIDLLREIKAGQKPLF